MSSIKVEPEGSGVPNWVETSNRNIKQEGPTTLSEDAGCGIDDATVLVTLHVEEDELLKSTTNEISAASKDGSSDQQDEGYKESQPPEINSHWVQFSITHPMYLRGTSSNDTGPSAPSSKVIVNDDPCTQLSHSLQSEGLTTVCQRESFSQIASEDNIHGANELTAKIRESQCQLCENSNVQLDMQQIILVQDRSLQSKLCRKHFNSKTPCSQDGVIQNEKQFQCQFCEKLFKFKRDCTNHEMMHTDERPFKCQFCQKLFRRSSTCKIHEMIHTGEKPFKCQFCMRPFTRKQDCKYHEMTHTGEKPYKCHFCEKVFTKKQHCRYHEMIHTGEKPFKCQFCEKTFNRKQNCKSHEMTHTGERPFRCQVCEKSFINKRDCKNHEMAHASEEPCECKFCGKFFTKKWNCKLHEMTHSGEKPFKCQFCEKTFKKEKKCKKHERTHVDDKALEMSALEGVSHQV
ncbi:Zinc finger protein 14 [Holothuria leucospilota]|uniref:Zinc finger protein 14 n=1 Tax=Holothuria leucospilota TaxID=206669 RepID=A0A9Q1BQ20_HOLLE|nr:Zinc finger protein 14 [Holothuria leucospilota]